MKYKLVLFILFLSESLLEQTFTKNLIEKILFFILILKFIFLSFFFKFYFPPFCVFSAMKQPVMNEMKAMNG
jgi:hypothetical protein